MYLKKIIFVSVFNLLSISITAQFKLHTVPVTLQNKLQFNLSIPEGYGLSVAAQGLERPRFFAKAPDGRLFVTDMHNLDDNKQGRILILTNWNEQEHRFQNVIPFMEHLHNPNQIVFYIINNKNYLYVAETDKLTVYDYTNNSIKQSEEGKVLAHFPDYGLSYKYGGWHLTRSLAIHNNKLYVSIGSSCNACLEKEKLRACILEMNMDGSGQRLYATGLRNAVSMQWLGNQLWATNMGRDGIGPDKPEDLLLQIKDGGYYGWPFYYQYKQTIEADKQFKDSAKPAGLQTERPGWCGFAAHAAPLGLCWFSGFADSLFNNHCLVALHGSTTVKRQRGNAVVIITGKDKYVPVVTGFLQGKTEAVRYGRPCDVMQWDNHSFFVSDDKKGVIYYIWQK